jgi:hypothetical protein
MKYEINTDAAQEVAIEQELKIANGQRLTNLQSEWTKEQFVQEFFNQQLNPFKMKWGQQDITRIVAELQKNPERAAEVAELLKG